MKRIKLLLLELVAAVVFCAGCVNEVERDESIHIPISSCDVVDYLSPEQAYGTTPKYIRLLNADSSDYAIGSIRKIIIKDERVFISDYRGLSLFVFDINGNPLCKMDFVGRGPKEFLQISDFDVDDEGYIWIVDARKNALLKYSNDCSFVCSFPFLYEIWGINCIESSGDFLFQLANFEGDEYTNTMLAVSDTTMRIKKELLLYPKYKDDNFVYPTCMSKGDSSVFFQYPTDYHLYEMEYDGSVRTEYFLDYGDFLIPENYRSHIERYYEKICQEYYVVMNTYRVSKPFITFGVSHGEWYSVIMNQKTNEISYFDYNDSGFSLIGQCSEGSIWRLSEGAGFESLPQHVRTWILDGNDVLAVYPDPAI